MLIKIQCVQKVTVHLHKVLEVMSTSVYTGLNPFNFIHRHFLQICIQEVTVHLKKVLEVMSIRVHTGLNPYNFINKHFLQICIQEVTVHLKKVLEVMSRSIDTGLSPFNFIRKHFLQICVQKITVHLQKVLEVMSTSVYIGLYHSLIAQRLSERTVLRNFVTTPPLNTCPSARHYNNLISKLGWYHSRGEKKILLLLNNVCLSRIPNNRTEQTNSFDLDRCTEHFPWIGERNQLMLKGVVSSLLCSLNPRHVSASKCHSSGGLLVPFLSYSSFSLCFGWMELLFAWCGHLLRI
jgi:hypothetical protein